MLDRALRRRRGGIDARAGPAAGSAGRAQHGMPGRYRSGLAGSGTRGGADPGGRQPVRCRHDRDAAGPIRHTGRLRRDPGWIFQGHADRQDRSDRGRFDRRTRGTPASADRRKDADRSRPLRYRPAGEFAAQPARAGDGIADDVCEREARADDDEAGPELTVSRQSARLHPIGPRGDYRGHRPFPAAR